jgi:hypothetical protein
MSDTFYPINPWRVDYAGSNADSDEVSMAASSFHTIAPGTYLGVYQARSSRSQGEIISSDQY